MAYEYIFFKDKHNPNPFKDSRLEDEEENLMELNKLGKQGWRVVLLSPATTSRSSYYLLERLL
jgi:hypothetical protein